MIIICVWEFLIGNFDRRKKKKGEGKYLIRIIILIKLDTRVRE